MKFIGNGRLKNSSFKLIFFTGLFFHAWQVFSMSDEWSSANLFLKDQENNHEISSNVQDDEPAAVFNNAAIKTSVLMDTVNFLYQKTYLDKIVTNVGKLGSMAIPYLPNAMKILFNKDTSATDLNGTNKIINSSEQLLSVEEDENQFTDVEISDVVESNEEASELPSVDRNEKELVEVKISDAQEKNEEPLQEDTQEPVLKRKKKKKKPKSRPKIESSEGWTKSKQSRNRAWREYKKNQQNLPLATINEIDGRAIKQQIKDLLRESKSMPRATAVEPVLKALDLARKLKNVEFEAESLNRLGNLHYLDDNHQRSGSWHFEALEKLKHSYNISLIVHAYLGLAHTRYHGHQIKWLREAERLLGEDGDVYLRAKLYNAMGNAKFTDEYHPKDTDWFLHTLHIMGENGDPYLIAQAYNGLGNANFEKKQPEWFLKALDILGPHRSPHMRIQSYNGLGRANYENTPMKWFEKALAIADENQEEFWKVQSYIGIGRSQNSDDENPSRWFKNAFDIVGENGDPFLLAQIYLGFGHSEYEGMQAKWYLKVLELKDQIDNIAIIVQAYIGLAQIVYEGEQEKWYRKALDLLNQKDDPYFRAQIYIGMGNAQITDDLHKYDTDWYQEALAILGPDGDPSLRAQCFLGFGNAGYQDVQECWFVNAFELLNQYPNKYKAVRARAMLMLGHIDYTDDKHEDSLEWFLDVLALLAPNGDAQLRSRAMIALGERNHLNNNHRNPMAWYTEALNLGVASKDMGIKVKAYKAIFRHYWSQGAYSKAFEIESKIPVDQRGDLNELRTIMPSTKSRKRYPKTPPLKIHRKEQQQFGRQMN